MMFIEWRRGRGADHGLSVCGGAYPARTLVVPAAGRQLHDVCRRSMRLPASGRHYHYIAQHAV